MSYVAVLQYHAIWILERHDERRLSGFAQVPNITLVLRGKIGEVI